MHVAFIAIYSVSKIKRETQRYVIFDLGTTDLVVSASTSEVKADLVSYGSSACMALSFLSSDLEGDIERLRLHGVPVVREIASSPEGKLAVVSDPDGHFLELIG